MEPIHLPALTPAQKREVDQLLAEEYRITRLQTLENAGRALALMAKMQLDGEVVDRPVVVLAGRGQKGSGGLAAARHLLNWGAWVQVVCADPPESYTGEPAQQLASVQAMGAPLAWAEEGWKLPPCDLVIDAVVGLGLEGDPVGRVRDLIQLANSSPAPILSLELPSGLDAETGRLRAPHIQAAATLALALPVASLLAEPGRSAAGKLYLADVGVPPELYVRLGLEVPPVFGRDPILRLEVVDAQAVVR
jgi:NAD(P)H-hydrate epimerase